MTEMTPKAATGAVLYMPGILAAQLELPGLDGQRERTVRAYQSMCSARGWDEQKLRKCIGKRGVHTQAHFADDGLELTLFMPSASTTSASIPAAEPAYHIRLRLKLRPDCSQFDAVLVACVATETRALHAPIAVPVVNGARAQADAVMRVHAALAECVAVVVGVENLPGWPGLAGIADMHRRVALRARQCTNALNTITELA